MGAIHSTKISGNFGPKLNGSVRSNRKSFEKTGPPFEVVLFSPSDRLEFWLNGSRPISFENTPRFALFYDWPNDPAFRLFNQSKTRHALANFFPRLALAASLSAFPSACFARDLHRHILFSCNYYRCLELAGA